jgi:hypothetical protein
MVKVLLLLITSSFLTACIGDKYTIDMAAEKIIRRKESCSQLNIFLNKEGWEIINDQGNIYCFIKDSKKTGIPGFAFSDEELRNIIRYESIRGNK